MQYWIKKIGLMSICLGISGCASFELTSLPPGVARYEREPSVGQTPYGFDQFSGERTFTLRAEGYVDQEVTVSSLDPKGKHVVLQLVKVTELNSVPTDVLVTRLRDNQELGSTSLALALTRPERVQLEKEGYRSRQLTLVPNQRYKVEMEPLEGFRSVLFSSKPTGAQISDRSVGDAIAATPARISAEEGTEFEFTLEGYQPAYYMMNKRSPRKVFVELIPVPTVTLHSEDGAAVYGAGGGEKLGDVPYTQQIRDVRAFEIRKTGYYPKTATVSPESPAEVYVKLEAIPLKRIVSVPAGAMIARIGKRELLGTAPLSILAGSERLIEVYMEGYVGRIIGLGPDSPEEIIVELQPVVRDRMILDEVDDATITVF